jgi:hypothetical protein
MTDPTPEPSPDAEAQNAGQIPPVVDPQEILNAISGLNMAAIEADIESSFGARMAELDKMLEGLDDLVNKIESDIQNLDQPKPDSPQ